MYESFFRLKEKPFSLLPDTGYLYLSRKHGTALALLEYCLLRQDGFCVISGEAGVGKTTLIRRLLSEYADRFTIGLVSNTQGSLGELLGWISVAFGLEYQDRTRSQLYEDFLRFLADQHARDRQTVLIIDEAQNISAAMVAELRVLSRPSAGSSRSLKTVLIGQPQLRATLGAPGLEQFARHIAVDYHLGPLSRAETGEYIRHRLSVAGGDPGIFDDEACDAVFHYSGGIPRLTNLLCDNVLACAYALKRTTVGADIVHSVMREREVRGTLPQFATRPAAEVLRQTMPATASAAEEQPMRKRGVVGGVLPVQPGLNDEAADPQRGTVSRLVGMGNWPRNERRAAVVHQVMRTEGGGPGREGFGSHSSMGTTDVASASPAGPGSEAQQRPLTAGPGGGSPGDMTATDLEGGEGMGNYRMVPLAADQRPRVFWGTAVMLGFVAGLLVAVILIGAVYLDLGRIRLAVRPSRTSVAPSAPVAVAPPVVLPPAPAPVAAATPAPALPSRAVAASRLRELRNERDAAIAEARALQRERDAALAVAKARERAAQAELRAALAEERAQAALRRRSAEERTRPAPAPVIIVAARPKQTAKAVPDIRQPAPPPVKSAAPKALKFSPNPCNGPAAKFLSTCKE